MERNGLKIGSFAGAPIIVDWTVAILAGYLVFTDLQRGGVDVLPHSLLFIAALFIAILAHEMGHAGVAAAFKIRSSEIVLTFFGGHVSYITPPRARWHDILVTAAGPAVNLALWALVSLVIGPNLPDALLDHQNLTYFLSQLAYVNVVLGLFNLLPGYPLDGGAVLSALLSYFMRAARARWVAAWSGVIIATLVALYGLYLGLLWTAGIGALLAFEAFQEVNRTSRVLNGR